MEEKNDMTAVCGLDCESCEIRKAPFDPEAAQSVVAWFKQMDWLKEDEGINEIIERVMYCRGCRGDRSVHWSADCWILKCCVDLKGLEYCYQCEDFPCSNLTDWAKKSTDYTDALNRLKYMKEKTV